MKRSGLPLLIVLTLSIMLSSQAAAEVPGWLTYQGRLFDSMGEPLTGPVSMTFTVYDAAVSGDSLWAETHGTVDVENGFFTVLLGSVNPISALVFDQSEKYLGIRIGSDAEISPRTPLSSSPYAFRAATVEGFSPGENNNPAGAYAFTAGDSNTVLADYGSVAGGYGNMAGLENFADSTFDTTGIFDESPLTYAFDSPQPLPLYPCVYPPWWTPSFVGGGFNNVAIGNGSGVGWGGNNTAFAGFSTIAGGAANYAEGDLSFIGGGYCNQTLVAGRWQTIGGGIRNHAYGTATTVGGGAYNVAPTNFVGGTIGGGFRNTTQNHVSTIAGGYNNFADGFGATVGGGQQNQSTAQYTTVSGGRDNISEIDYATIGGGSGNRVHDQHGTVAGGQNNITQFGNHQFVGGGEGNIASYPYSTISGGLQNEAYTWATVGGGQANLSQNEYTFIGGGLENQATQYAAVVSGGIRNVSGNWATTVGGGGDNLAESPYSTVGGGYGNVAVADSSVVSGGTRNAAIGFSSVVAGGVKNASVGVESAVGGGTSNSASGQNSTVGGGSNNSASGNGSTVGGGAGNTAGPGVATTVPGGNNNEAVGDYSFAAGVQAKAVDDCAFVWSDCCRIMGTTDIMPLYSTGANTFNARATGGFYFFTGCDSIWDPAVGPPGAWLPSGGSQWLALSDSTQKENITPVDNGELLDKVADLPIYRWSYKAQDPSIQHIGPMAQDFYATFGIGDNDKSIASLDPAGIALAAIKELNKKVQEVEALKLQLENNTTELAQLKLQVQALLAKSNGSGEGTGDLAKVD